MKTKNREFFLSQASDYLNKTKNHLFQTRDGYFYKIETFENDNKLYYATIIMGKGKLVENVGEVISEVLFKLYGDNTLNVFQSSFFPSYYKASSIKNFKKMKSFVKEIMSEIKPDNTLNKELVEKFKTRLFELEKVV